MCAICRLVMSNLIYMFAYFIYTTNTCSYCIWIPEFIDWLSPFLGKYSRNKIFSVILWQLYWKTPRYMSSRASLTNKISDFFQMNDTSFSFRFCTDFYKLLHFNLFQMKPTMCTLLLSIFISTSVHASCNCVPIIRRTYCICAILVYFTPYGWLSALQTRQASVAQIQ